ncbi:MAG: hypothetical protein MRY83_04655 [Flavobacteriales bacterium]|nr:hypothetical protein [Flavobacteriales bacterium]
MHRAAQYLAAAGISFLEKKPDDSHANFMWDVHLGTLFTHPLNRDDISLGLNYENFSIDFLESLALKHRIPLKGKSHKVILESIREKFWDLGFKKPYKYEFHYNLKYGILSDNYIWEFEDSRWLKDLITLRNVAQLAISYEAQNHINASAVRVWPHHFDTSASLTFDGTNKSITVGLAIPDNMVSDFYYYAYGWDGRQILTFESVEDLSIGKWIKGKWSGAVLEASDVSHQEVELFLKESIQELKVALGILKSIK